MSKYIEIPDNIISLIKYTNIHSFNDGLTKLNIIHHFITSIINNQIHILTFMSNTTNFGINDEDEESNEELKEEIKQLSKNEISEKVINDYESLIEIRNFYLSEQDFIHFGKLQTYIIPLFKQTELYYYEDYELDDIPGILKDIENKINYIDEYHDDISNETSKIEIDKVSYDKCQMTYQILNYLYDLYSTILTNE